jgi:RHS repeat-associated protein
LLEKKSSRIFFSSLFIVLFLLSISNVLAAEEFKPYLHKAEVPEHPTVKLYGTYSTDLFPGAATYNYQIEVPPGTNGLQPSLTISYNSQNAKQRPGILGSGWSLPSIYVFRDVNGTVNETDDDMFKLVFNGAVHELVYNTSDEFYHTEIESYIRIENLSTTANDYGTYWLVTTSDGTNYKLGNSTSSELTSNSAGQNHTVRWSLNSIKDTYNNTVFYAYSENPRSEDNGSVYLDNITYNNNQARLIEFFYESTDRPDRRLVYEQGNALEESRRLIGINITVDSTLLRQYDFEYVDLNPEQSLSSISKISFLDAADTELHNAQFTYYNATHGFTKNTDSWIVPTFFQTVQNNDEGARLVDINNDGLVDIVNSSEAAPIKVVWINNGSGWVDESSSWNSVIYIVDVNYTDNGVRFADVNNDGFVDIIQSHQKSVPDPISSAYLHNGSGWIDASDVWSPPAAFVTNSEQPAVIFELGLQLIELNGDGYIDLIQGKGDGNIKKAWLNNRSGWIETSNWTPPDLFVWSDFTDMGLRVVDLNGDGLDDLIMSKNLSPPYGKHKDAWLNTGSGWINVSPRWFPPTSFVEDQNVDAGVRFADINGDGLTDMWHNGNDEGGVANRVWLNNGSGWLNSPGWKSPEKFVEAGKNKGRRLADINGDGLPDIVTSQKNSSGELKYVWLKNGTIPYTLKTIKTELGANITISYQNSTYFNHTNSSGFSRLGFNMLVVSDVVQNNSLTGSFNTISNSSYNYTGGNYDNRDREFRGFGIVKETLSDNTIIKHYFLQDAVLKGKENRTEIYDSQENLYSVQENTYNYTQIGSHFNVILKSSTTYTHDGQAANPKITNASFTYDQYGNLLRQNTFGDISIPGDEKLELYNYVYNTTAWILNTQSWYQLFASDNTTKLREVKYIYDDGTYSSDPSRGSITAIETWLDTGDNHRTESTYGNNGELLTTTDPLGRKTKYNYDSTKTFIEQVINPLGHPTRFSYDLGTGNLLWQEKNGIKTYFFYDNFSRIEKEVQPFDTLAYPTKTYNYTFDGTAPEIIKVTQKTTANNTLDTYYYYDGFGQLAQIKTPSYDNQQTVKNFFYDGLGKVKSEQNPYFDSFSTALSTESSTAAYTNYTYDILDRVTNVTFPDYTNITVVFNHWNISTFDQNTHQKDYILDAYDRIIQVREYNIDPTLNDGAIYIYNTTYGYDDADQLIEIIDTNGNNFSFTYDSLGRRTRLNDPDIGEWNYTYDIAGNLVSQAGGGGNLITGDGFFREYNNLNQLIRIRNGSSVSGAVVEEYYYDPYGERIKIWRNDSAQTVVYTPFRELMQVRNTSGIFNYSYIYDGSVLVARLNPDGTKHYYHPDHLGSTTLVTDSTGNIVEETFYEPFGDVTSGGSSEVKLYTGQFSDSATGQYYYGARYYKPEWGRFVQADEISFIYIPQSLNRYSYVYNNPYFYVDPNGKWAIAIDSTLSGGFLLGGTLTPLGIAFSYTEKTGFEIGPITTIGGGAYGGIKGSASIGFLYFSDADSVDDVRGGAVDLAADLFLGLGGGLKASFPLEEAEKLDEEDPIIDKILNPKPTVKGAGYGAYVGVGAGASGSGFATRTFIPFKLSFGGKSNFFSSQGGDPIISDDGRRVMLGSGGNYDSFKCFARSCSAFSDKKSGKDETEVKEND